LTRFLDHTFLIAAVAAVLLTVVYGPIRQISQLLVNRLLFGQHYDYQAVIHNYSQAISNRLFLGELANEALEHVKATLGVDGGALFIVDRESDERFSLRSLPAIHANGLPKSISLKKNTPITYRLVNECLPLAQYTVDLSPNFKQAPEDERLALKELNFEWFIPILKKEQLIGVLALGPKRSGQSYSAQDLRLLITLADQTGLALENAALFDRVQRNLEEISRMKNLMDNVFDSIDNGVITTDVHGRITLFNRAAEAILAVSSEHCVGVSYTEALPALANTILYKLMLNVTSRESHYANYEFSPVLPGRGKVDLSVNLAPLKDAQNQTLGVTLVMDDLTETKRLRAVQDMFRRYVSPAVVDRLPSNPEDLQLGGHRQTATILFADIRGFTAFSEKMAPEALVETLNQYLSIAATSILVFEGTLDKFMGDALMGIFNAPLEQQDHALRAVRAAASMQRAIADYHRNIGQQRKLSSGVGVHVGEVVVGNVGMSDRMDYTAIGDAVNLAKRIQENAPGGMVLLSETVYDLVKDKVDAVFYKEMRVKGRESVVKTFELLLP
jgi:PAS domain S-box-containing protein